MNSLIGRLGIRPFLWMLLVASMAACALAWVGSVKFADARIMRLVEAERKQAQSAAELASANVGQRLAQAQSSAMTLAEDPMIQAALERFGPNAQASPLPLKERGEIWRADPLLQPLELRMEHIVKKFEFNTLWATNAAGDTVVEGHATGVTPFTGTNYADRAYFKAARQGQNGRQFAIGRATNVYGLFFASPVQIQGEFVGIVGVGLSVAKLGPAIAQVNAVVTDDLGVIVLAKDPELFMQTMPGATVHTLSVEERDRRYKRQEFKAVDISPAEPNGLQVASRWRNVDAPHIIESHPTSDGALRVYVLRDLDVEFAHIRRDQLWWFGLCCMLVFMAASLVAGAAQFVITKQRQHAILRDLNQVLARQANTDVLTGCANRRHFMQALEDERNRSNRYGFDFCVLSLDIDHFKRVNDTYGHAAGDAVLKHFVTTIQGNLRDVDLLGRVGGEEFCILLPQTPAEGGALMAERIRASVEASPTVVDSTRLAITVSIGGMQWKPGSHQPVSELLARTDEALYTAKLQGRNRVEWADLPDAAANADAVVTAPATQNTPS